MAWAALTRLIQTAPADRRCSHSGILPGMKRDTTTTARGGIFSLNIAVLAFSGSGPSPASCSTRASNAALAAPSSTTKRQGDSLPWSGTRTASRKRSRSSSADGAGARRVAAEAERRRAMKASTASDLAGAGRPAPNSGSGGRTDGGDVGKANLLRGREKR